jgi:hypothetical protein
MHRLQSLPSLKRLEFFSPQSQGLVAAYLTHLQARQYAATTVQSTLDALNSFCVLLPAVVPVQKDERHPNLSGPRARRAGPHPPNRIPATIDQPARLGQVGVEELVLDRV